MISTAVASSHRGLRRRENEDRYALAPELGLFVVADGMGGHTAGQIASQLACDTALRAIHALEGAPVSPAEKLRQAAACANHAIFEEAQRKPDLTGMGTTLVALLASGNRMALAHVGDSRAYLIRAGQMRRLTDDHSLVGDLLRRHEISEDTARGHPQRHVLTRAVGIRRQVEADLAEITPQDGDLFVLCSDGLTTHLMDAEIGELAGRAGELQTTCDELVDRANQRGGEDNTTVVLVRISV